MREIKFRGKRIDNGEEVYGYFFKGDKSWILQDKSKPYTQGLFPSKPIEVVPETVGQYIGLKDKKGVEIYADDLVSIRNLDCQLQIFEAIGRVAERNAAWGLADLRIIKFEKYSPGIKPPDAADMMYFLNIFDCKVIEIIGNIHENPELLKDNEKE